MATQIFRWLAGSVAWRPHPARGVSTCGKRGCAGRSRADFLDAHLHLASLLQRMNRLADALASAEHAAAIAPNHIGAAFAG